MASHLYIFLLWFSEVFDEIWTILFWDFFHSSNVIRSNFERILETDDLIKLFILAIDFQYDLRQNSLKALKELLCSFPEATQTYVWIIILLESKCPTKIKILHW